MGPNERRERRRRRALRRKIITRIVLSAAVLVMCIAAVNILRDDTSDISAEEASSGKVSQTGLPPVVDAFAVEHNLTAEDYPESILELLEKNPETKQFVLEYPLEYGKEHEIDMSKYKNVKGVPLFMQWDKRWGYIDYGDDVAGLNACGPVTLAMAGYYFTHSDDFRPDRVIQFALDNGYCIPGKGSSWTLISEGAEKLGLDVTEITPEKNRMIENLEEGKLIICAMGPGDFTDHGHYILITGTYKDKFRINDANSRKNSKKMWTYEEIKDQIENLWAVGK